MRVVDKEFLIAYLSVPLIAVGLFFIVGACGSRETRIYRPLPCEFLAFNERDQHEIMKERAIAWAGSDFVRVASILNGTCK